MEIPPRGDIENPARVPDHGIGKELAVRENVQRIAEGLRISRDMLGGLGHLLQQPLHEAQGRFRVRQGRQQRLHHAHGGGGQLENGGNPGTRTKRVTKLDLFQETQHLFPL